MRFNIKMPGRYYQSVGELNNINQHINSLNCNYVIIVSTKSFSSRRKDLIEKLKNLLTYDYEFVYYEGVYKDILYSNHIDGKNICIISLGGGSVIDYGKYLSHINKLPIIVVPTYISSDAPCTSIIVPKTYDHKDTMLIRMDRSPDIIIADLSILINTPPRLFVSGIGDALSTYYEARVCSKNKGLTLTHGDFPPKFGKFSQELDSLLFMYSRSSLSSLVHNEITESFEYITYSCIYLSGVLSENCGIGIPHAFSLALDEAGLCKDKLHGEKVACGILLQLLIENKAPYSTKYFLKGLNLPTNLSELGIDNNDHRLLKVADSISENKVTKNLLGEELTSDFIESKINLLYEM